MSNPEETTAALDRVAKRVPNGTKPTATHTYPVDHEEGAEHMSVKDTLEDIQKEQQGTEFQQAQKELTVAHFEDAETSQLPKPTSTTPMPEVKPPKQEEEHTQNSICPRCSWNSEVKVIKPSEDDLKEFARTILGDKTFAKTYALMGGALKIEFRALSASERQTLQDLLKTAEPAGDERSPLEVLKEVRSIQAMYSLESIKTGTNSMSDFPSLGQAANMQEAYASFLDSFSSLAGPVIDILTLTYLEFDRLNSTLVDAAFDSDFWKGAGLT
jgi:hypothetical protein